MSEFKLGDLVEFIPENFDYPKYTYRLMGIGYIEQITEDNIYFVYCGKVTKQQMKNFAELELKDKTFSFTEEIMRIICRKLNSK
jgi:hypothetical protein